MLIEKSTPHKIVIPENLSSKLCIRDYVGNDKTMQVLVQISSVGTSPQVGEIGL